MFDKYHAIVNIATKYSLEKVELEDARKALDNIEAEKEFIIEKQRKLEEEERAAQNSARDGRQTMISMARCEPRPAKERRSIFDTTLIESTASRSWVGSWRGGDGGAWKRRTSKDAA